MNNSVGPTKFGKFVGLIFVLACVGAAAYLFKGSLFPKAQDQAKPGATQTATAPADAQGGASQPAGGQPAAAGSGPEAKDPNGGITTVKEYKYVPQDKLPPVKGASNYKWNDADKTIVFPINVWIGWLPIVAANHGFAPNAESVFFKKYGFKVNLKLIDDPVTARDTYVNGESQVLWGTLDMMALFAPGLMKDSRTAPRIFQQVDWSNGGDGIVVRSRIASVKDLRGKKIVYAQNSPSQYFINNLLLNAGIQPNQVNSIYTASAFEAAAAFVADPTLDACVSWAPDIYNIPDKVKGTRILTTTAEANKLIADVYAVRADFAKDHPDIVEGLVAGIFEGMDLLKDSKFQGQAMQWMADGYGMTADQIKGMINDAHSTNFPENKDYFLNENSPANFERTWKNITFVYRELGLIGTPVRFDEVMDFSVIKNLEAKGLFKEQQNLNTASFAPTSYQKLSGEKPILTQTIRINFYPNSANIYEPQHNEAGQPMANTLYDPNAAATIERVARLAGQYERANIAVVGHSDSSMKGQAPRDAVLKLSQERAKAVAQALIEKYKFDPNKFTTSGKAWDEPADPADPTNQTLNRRVEISVYSPEQQGQ